MENASHVDISTTVNYGCTFSPLDTLMKTSEENKKLCEHLVKAERDKVSYYLEKLTRNK
jgi:sterol desaturase/sphingolipid hydroxylase (fatty acid hydroxylase superfamily)